MTTDVDGKRAYVMTLQAARAAHPPREGGQQHLHQPDPARPGRVRVARLARPHGLRDVAALGAARAAELEAALASVGVARVHAGAYLNEFAVRVPNAPAVHRALLDRGVLAGLVLAEAVPDEPGLADAAPRLRHRVTTGDDIATFAREIGAGSAMPGRARVRRPRRLESPHERQRAAPAADAVRAVEAWTGSGKVPHPPADALDRLRPSTGASTPQACPR